MHVWCKKSKVILLTNLHRDTVFTYCSTCCLIGYATCAIWFYPCLFSIPTGFYSLTLQFRVTGWNCWTLFFCRCRSINLVPRPCYAPSNPAINIEMPILITYCFNTPNLHILYIYTDIYHIQGLLKYWVSSNLFIIITSKKG